MREPKDSITKIKVDGCNIYCSCMDGKVYNYDIRMGMLDIDNFKTSVHNISMSNDGNTYAASILNNQIKLIDRSDGQILQIFQDHKSYSYSTGMLYSQCDKFIYSGSEDGSILIYEIKSGKYLKKMKEQVRTVSCIDMNEKNHLVSSSYDGTVVYWEAC